MLSVMVTLAIMTAPHQVVVEPEKSPMKMITPLPKIEVQLADQTQIAESTTIPQRSPQPINAVVIGNKVDWLRAAGIPESDWQYVDFIVSNESGWNPNAVNAGSGACGLVQALPCSKLGTQWNNPVNALKWQYSYVTDRYGGYAQAYAFWQANHWY